MSKIQINDLDDLNVEQCATLTDLEAADIQGGLEDGTAAAIGLVGLSLGAIAAAPAIAGFIAGAAVISSGIGVYQAFGGGGSRYPVMMK